MASSPTLGRRLRYERRDCPTNTDGFWADVYRRLAYDREDAGAWRALEERVRVRAQAQLARRGWAVVEDVVSETCAAVAVSFGRARGPESFDGFVFGHYLNARRRALLHVLRPHQPLDGVDLPVPDREYPDPELLATLRRCVAALPAREREAVRLRYFEDAATADVAGRLRVTPTNARVILTRAMAHLRSAVGAGLVRERASA
jgi:RNA polymerase sigma-70 factor (ECF subfamily)